MNQRTLLNITQPEDLCVVYQDCDFRDNCLVVASKLHRIAVSE